MSCNKLMLPESYRSLLGLLETQHAIKLAKDDFERRLAESLDLTRVSAPMFVRPETGLNDNLNGVERAVSFDVPDAGFSVEIVHSLAKWKRYALDYYGFEPGKGLYTDMNAIRRDEELDNLHSVYVDQWDWEKIITAAQRDGATLKSTVRAIVHCMAETEGRLAEQFPQLGGIFSGDVHFVTSQQLLDAYPDLAPKQREDEICKKYGTVFIQGIGGKLSDGSVHDRRAPDYDDWQLNGDILVWYPPLGRAVELSSMGIRVDEYSLLRQLELAGHTERERLPFHSALLSGSLPLTIGGGIGQSRICMVFLQKAHIGEVQASVWPQREVELCHQNGIELL